MWKIFIRIKDFFKGGNKKELDKMAKELNEATRKLDKAVKENQ